MQKALKALVLFLVCGFVFSLVSFALADEIKTITLDGNFDEWNNVPILLTHTQTSYPDFKGTTYYWNNDTHAWQTTELSNACMYNETRSLDLSLVKFANNGNYLYFYWEKNSDYTNFFWKTFPNDPNNTSIDEQSFAPEPVTKLDPVSQSEPPCLGESLYLPIAFNHDMVFGLDTNLDMKYEYYLILNIAIPYGTTSASMDTVVTSFIYKDKSNGVYNGRANETLVSNLGSDFQMEVSAIPCQHGVCQEGRLGIDTFFTDLKIDWGKSVLVDYEAHSAAAIFKTARGIYSFNKKNKLNFKITSPVRKNVITSSKKITLKGNIKKGARITVYVNNKKITSLLATSKKFKISNINLPKKNNVIVLKARLGKKLVVKGLVVKKESSKAKGILAR